MRKEFLLYLFERCQNAKYITVENHGDYAVEIDGATAFLLFQWSNGEEDWKNNFNFPARPYKDMQITWFAHRGFLKVWKSIEPYLKEIIADKKIKSFIIVGYSHGAALASFCHEYVWFNRPDVRSGILGVGFGSPRIYFGAMREELRERWENFFVVRNLGDIVTHLPPVLFGFRHVVKPTKIGSRGEYASKETIFQFVNAHYPENYIHSLSKREVYVSTNKNFCVACGSEIPMETDSHICDECKKKCEKK